ncbi:MAG: hypothetical protein R2725_03205 [Solirubrobacterales bacterium]
MKAGRPTSWLGPGGALALAIALAVAGCGAGSGDPSTPAGPAAAAGGSARTDRGADRESGSGGSGEGKQRRAGQGGGPGDGKGDDPASRGGGSGRPEGGGRSGQGDDAVGGGGSGSFVVPGGDNSIQTYGDEAGPVERDAASAVLEAYMKARARADSRVACANLAEVAYRDVANQVAAAAGADCIAVVDALDRQIPASARANTMTGPIGDLRVGGGRAFALYHGSAGVDYTIQMTREGGSWKVAALVPFELP